MKTVTLQANSVKLIENELEINEMASSASISLNPNVTWLKLILTDDVPNANRQRVPREEFANVLKTGVFMPLKMAENTITEGHKNTKPLGAMSHLRVEGNTVVALAALWHKERPDDVKILKERYANGKPIDISWELTYTDDEIDDEGIQTFRNVSMDAATVVSLPAYEGRTPVVAMSSKSDGTTDYNEGEKETMTDSMDVEQKETTEEITAPDEVIETPVTETVENEVQDNSQDVDKLKGELESLTSELASLKQEYAALVEYKTSVETEKARIAKEASIKDKFSSAGISVSDTYLEGRMPAFLDMSDEQLNFFVQEMVAAFSTGEGTQASEASVSITSDIPNIDSGSKTISFKDIVKFLRKLDEE